MNANKLPFFYPKIKIAYAYDGFIYLPLFLAKEFKLLPECVSIVYAGSDDAAIDKLFDDCDFAICDPYIDINQPTTHHGEPKLIGCLIDKSPFWLYAPDQDIHSISKGGLNTSNRKSKLALNVKRILRYPSTTTGYYYGEDLKERLDNVKIETIDTLFTESDDDIKPKKGEILVTSNILRIAKIKNERPSDLIYVYAGDSIDKLSKSFFTGILTKENILQNYPHFVHYFFISIRETIRMIYDEKLPVEELAKVAIQAFDNYRDDNSLKINQYKFFQRDREDEILKYVALSLEQIRNYKYYNENLTLDKKLWFKTKNWRQHIDTINEINKNYVSYYDYAYHLATLEKIYSNIIKGNNLRQLVYKLVRNLSPLFKIRSYVLPISLIVTSIILAIINFIITNQKNQTFWIIHGICFAATIGFIFLLAQDFKKYKRNRRVGSIISAYQAIFIATVIALLIGCLLNL